MTYEDLRKANESIKTTNIQGKEYAEVNQRIKAFRMIYPEGFITTEMLSNENGVCVFKASIGYHDENGEPRLLGTGTAYEKEGSSFINKGSFIENCETSAVGRGLGMIGIGIDTSVASAEEVQNAINNSEPRTATPKQVELLSKVYKGENLAKLLNKYGIASLQGLPLDVASEIIGKLQRKEN